MYITYVYVSTPWNIGHFSLYVYYVYTIMFGTHLVQPRIVQRKTRIVVTRY